MDLTQAPGMGSTKVFWTFLKYVNNVTPESGVTFTTE